MEVRVGVTTWLSVLEACSTEIRERVTNFFGSTEAGDSFGVGAGGDVTKKIDRLAENAIIDILHEQDVSCTLISEEIGVRPIGSQPTDYYLTVDPVDGTTNAIRGLPFTATSIAGSRTPHLQDVEVALVADLFHNMNYTAEKNCGAHCNGERIKPSMVSSVEEAVIGVDLRTFKIRKLIDSLSAVLGIVGHTRHLGANALEICYVADGKTDAFIDLRGKLRVTDAAAAYLVLQEAGGLMYTPEGAEINAPLNPTQRIAFIAAANIEIYEKISKLMNQLS